MMVASPPSLLSAMDKFRGTASARQLALAVSRAARERGMAIDTQLMSDGGEGFVDAFAGAVTVVEVPGPWGDMVSARITRHRSPDAWIAVVQAADVVGRRHLARPTPDEALAATSAGLGQLIVAATELHVDAVLVGCGDTATSDGGLGCYQVLRDAGGPSVPLIAATDVRARFAAAREYAEQKGVAARDLSRVDERLTQCRALYLSERGVDVDSLERAGAAGGIAGALAAHGAGLVSGFDAVAAAAGLAQRVARSSVVVTGEGRLDEGTLEGKVTWGVAELVDEGVPFLVVCGSVDDGSARQFTTQFPSARLVSLEERFGLTVAYGDVLSCVESVVADFLGSLRE